MDSRVYEPEVIRPGERLPARDPVAEKLAWLMDGMIPSASWSFGLDGIIGLVPGLGDMLGALISMIIVLRAVQARNPAGRHRSHDDEHRDRHLRRIHSGLR